ncbi:SpoIIE family protein phosphatase [Tunicatimonas pelagia]|uniref:SpoIIE family protein phosphatase n=1 Tax=Tunicatimonas pelagia TaxID=931531 RepID=UPI002665DCAC|nr:SpoIIE family protein phosphatase [Tunicatimonas pelagia]WKN45587.1 SpoIIE family protein phosphatase [Tunicatimonas pelagia]
MNKVPYHITHLSGGSYQKPLPVRQNSLIQISRTIALVIAIILGGHLVGFTQNTALPALSTIKRITDRDQLQQALQTAERELGEARANNAIDQEGELLHTIGLLHQKLRNDEDALKYLLWAISTFEKASAQSKLLLVKCDLGEYYFSKKAYQKAAQYYQAYLKGKKRLEEDVPDQLTILQKIARSNFELEEYEEAKAVYQQLVKRHKARNDVKSVAVTYEAIADISKRVNDLPNAIQYLEQVEKISRQTKDTVKLLHTLNNLGFLQKRNKNLKAAINYFQQALAIPISESRNQDMQVSMLTNLGVAYTNLGFFSRARNFYNEALAIERRSGNLIGQAQQLNYLASNAYMSQNNAQALKLAEQAIALGVRKNAYPELAESYNIVALVYKSDKNPEKAKIYLQSYADIRGRIRAQEKREKQKILALQERIDAQEEFLKSSIIEQEQTILDRERQENAISLKEKELALLKKTQALQESEILNQQLANEQAAQQLTLTQQELLSEKQKRELLELQRTQERQTLQLEQSLLEQEKQEKAIALLEAQKKLQQQRLQQEATLRKYGYGIISSFLVIMGVVSYSFVQKRKDHRKLQEQQTRIAEQNEHLKANEQMLISSVDELESTQEALRKQKKRLEIENYKNQESLQYAKRIQFSILPSERESQAIFPDSFVIFRPKDVVSGDFYWISEDQGAKIISVVDCTGHGVPGALVSLIAYNMLNEAIREKDLHNPSSILAHLNQQVTKRLRGRDNSVQDGMDIGICIFETNPDQSVQLRYVGAKHTLFLVRDNKLEVLKGIRKTVGSIKSDIAKSEYQMILYPGDSLYLTTDGFIDQSNPERKRFGSRRLKQVIQEIHHLPMQEQRTKFINALEAHQQSSEQRDDINLIGVKI